MSTIVLNKAPSKTRGKIVGKGIKSPKAIEWEARRAINRALQEFDAEMEYFKNHVEDYAPAQASRILSEMQEKWARKIEPIADRISENWLNAINERQKKKSMEVLRKALGVDISAIFEDPLIQQGLENMRFEAAYLIKTIPYDNIGKVAERVYQYYRGEPMPEGRTLTQQLAEEFKIKYERAKTIARDQTNKMNGNLTQIRQTSYGIEEYIWRTARDQRVVGNPAGFYPKGNRVHGNHWEREGHLYRWDEPPEDGHPGNAINCLLGETDVMFPHGAKKLFRRHYKGFIYIITTKSGALLKATPNHPILTSRGWLAVNALKQGDNLVKATINSGSITKDNNGKLVSEFGELWDSFNKSEICCSSSKFDFHGDGIEENVYIKDVNSLLPKYRKTFSLKSACKFFFSSSNMIFRRAFFTRNSSFSLCCVRSFRPSYGIVGGLNKTFSFFGRGLFHPFIHCGRLIADKLSVFRKDSFDDTARNAESLGNGLGTLAVDIARDYLFRGDIDNVMRTFFHFEYTPVVKIEKQYFDGFVYNAETPAGYYIANGIVNHNCRCFAEPVIDLDKLKVQYY